MIGMVVVGCWDVVVPSTQTSPAHMHVGSMTQLMSSVMSAQWCPVTDSVVWSAVAVLGIGVSVSSADVAGSLDADVVVCSSWVTAPVVSVGIPGTSGVSAVMVVVGIGIGDPDGADVGAGVVVTSGCPMGSAVGLAVGLAVGASVCPHMSPM